jgi:hypothetical protein
MHKSGEDMWNLAECRCSTDCVGALVGIEVSSVAKRKR